MWYQLWIYEFLNFAEYRSGIKFFYTETVKEFSISHKPKFWYPFFLQPDGVNLWYFKLRIFDLTEFLELKYLRSMALGCKDIEIPKLEFVAKTLLSFLEKGILYIHTKGK